MLTLNEAKETARKVLKEVEMRGGDRYEMESMLNALIETLYNEAKESVKYQSIEDCIARAKYLALNKAGSHLEVTLRFHND